MLKLGMQAVYYCLLFYCFLNDILMLCLPDSFSVDATSYTSLTDSFNFFLLGNKFSVSYLHLFALVFYYAITRLTGKRNRIKLFAHIVFAMFISAYVSCTTAIIGCILICFLWWREKFFVRLLSKPSFSLISIAIADSMLIVNSAIVTLPPVRYFVENVLKESIDLTGRIVAYSKLIPMISQSPWVGFGYENNYYISLEYLSIGNAQNGIMDCICSFGIVGTIVLILLVFLSIKKGNVERSYGFYTLLFVFIVLSAVETTMNLKFMSTLAFLAFAWDLEGFERAEQSAV